MTVDSSITYPGWYIDDVTGLGFELLPLVNNDIGTEVILSPGEYHFPNTSMNPTARIKNYGMLNQTNVPVVCSIVGQNSVLRYSNTQTVNIGVGETLRVNFTSWIPTIEEICTVKVRTNLPNDEFPANDRLVKVTSISPISQIQIGTATTSQRTEPLDRYYNYNTHEAIYLQSEIGVAGEICQISYYKTSGSNLAPITPVAIYMKQTTDTMLNSGTYSLSDYTQVYNWEFPNNATSGWMQVMLTTPFQYNNTSNLVILIIKGYQAYISSGYPYWNYTTTTTYLCRGARGDAIQPTNLTQTYNRPNIRFSLASSGVHESNNLNNMPIITALYSPKPNPITNGRTQISFSLAEPTKVGLKIYDASGRIVRTLVRDQQLATNNYSLIWNCRDDYNRKVAEGVYFISLETPNQKYTTKFIMTR